MSLSPCATEPKELFNRLRRVLSTLQLDCRCRATLDGALDRFSALEARRQLKQALVEARRKRNWIAAQLAFLADLDEVTENEGDDSVFEEMSALFDEICSSAADAAQQIRDARALMMRVGPLSQ